MCSDILGSHLPEHKNAREELIRNLGIEPTTEYYEEIAKKSANGDFKNAKGNLELVYNTKKYGILCERRFEVDSNSIVIGFVSNGCF